MIDFHPHDANRHVWSVDHAHRVSPVLICKPNDDRTQLLCEDEEGRKVWWPCEKLHRTLLAVVERQDQPGGPPQYGHPELIYRDVVELGKTFGLSLSAEQIEAGFDPDDARDAFHILSTANQEG